MISKQGDSKFGAWVGLLCITATLLGPGAAFGEEEAALSALDLSKMRQGWGEPRVDRSVQNKPLLIGGRQFERGVGTHATSVLHVELDGRAIRFSARVGVDDETGGKGTVRFKVYGDDAKLFDSDVMKGGDAAKRVDVPLRGVRRLVLFVGAAGDGIDFDHANWVEAVIRFEGALPTAGDGPVEERIILTPRPGLKPRINGPQVYGARPGRPFVYRIPTTGQRPMRFAADKLPATLELDSAAGVITGRTPEMRGEYALKFEASNAHGTDTRTFTIVVGDTLALTPPMGWNSWYIHYHRVTDHDMRAAAEAMVNSGMADFGYSYVNIDDCWMVKPESDDPLLSGAPLDSSGAIRPNGKFPDMKALADFIHQKGLKAGLYTSPGPRTCAGYAGSFEHEEADARKFAAWGFDFLKYDWCSYGSVATGEGRERLTKPYRKMGDILKSLDRDIVFNLCQYGMGKVWEWGGEVGGNCWRTTGDLGLVGGQLSLGIYQIGLHTATLDEHARPGQWNDPDYLLIGHVGDARNQGQGRPTTLTPNEQYTHMSMWCLMAAPLIFSGDMTKLDDFTLNILCNREVIEVNQDPLGTQARIVRRTDEELILRKEMADGSTAIGLFNLGEVLRSITVRWSELGVEGRQMVRDVWRQRNLGAFENEYRSRVGRHGAVLLRLRPPL